MYVIADEDMERENDVKTASVHFLRFQFDAPSIGALRGGAPLLLGSDHPEYALTSAPTPAQRESLLADFS